MKIYNLVDVERYDIGSGYSYAETLESQVIDVIDTSEPTMADWQDIMEGTEVSEETDYKFTVRYYPADIDPADIPDTEPISTYTKWRSGVEI